MAQQGNERAFTELYKRNINLIHKVASKYNSKNYDYEDVFSIASEGFIHAVKTYNVNKGCKFSTYVFTTMRNIILRSYRNDKNPEDAVSLFQEINTGDSKTSYLQDVLEDTKALHLDSMIIYKELKDFLYDFMGTLGSKDQKILQLALFTSKTQGDIGKEVGVSQVEVSRVLSKLRKQISEKATELGFIEGVRLSKVPKKRNKINLALLKYVFENCSHMELTDIALMFECSLASIRLYNKKYMNGELEHIISDGSGFNNLIKKVS